MAKRVTRVLAGRKALITGGDSGMGRAAAVAYAPEGADVAINYYPMEGPDAQKVAQLIQEAGRKAVAVPATSAMRIFAKSWPNERFNPSGGLDIVASNAGRQQSQESILDISTEQFDWHEPPMELL